MTSPIGDAAQDGISILRALVALALAAVGKSCFTVPLDQCLTGGTPSLSPAQLPTALTLLLIAL